MDGAGLDTALARHLDRAGALPREVLLDALREARARRALGGDLALGLTLVERRLLTREQVERALGALQAAKGVEGAAGSVGPYRLVRELGRGGMGVVHEVEHEATGARYALKRLHPGADPEERERFAREVEAQLLLDHSGLVRIFAADLARPDPYLVLELVPGGSLADRLRARGPLSPSEARRLGLELADALAYLHEAGVLHRDLKPQNVLLDPDGRARLSDFGLARLRGSLTLTATGELLGTPAYMPPEQVLDSKGVDERADVYALGAVLYAALTGEPPFRGGSALAVLDAVLRREPTPLLELAPGCPLDLAQVCARAMAKDPAARPQSARELAALLAGGGGRTRRGLGAAAAAALVGAAVAGALAGVFAPDGGEGAAPAAAASGAPLGSAAPALASAALLARATQLDERAAPAPQVFAALDAAVAAARDPDERAAARLASARVAFARGDDARVLAATEGLAEREARLLRALACLGDLRRRAAGQELLAELVRKDDRWGRLAAGARCSLSGGDLRAALGPDLVDSTDPYALLVTYAALRREERAQDAERLLTNAGVERGRFVPLLIDLAWLRGRLGRVAEAWSLLERAKALGGPDPARYHLVAAQLAQSANDHEAYLDHMRELYRADPRAQYAILLGGELERRGLPEEAATCYRDGAEADPAGLAEALEKLPAPQRLRVQRAAGLLVRAYRETTRRAPPGEATARWVQRAVHTVPPAEQRAAKDLLVSCAQGEPWGSLAPRLEPLCGRRASRAALALAAEVALWRDRLALASALLERVQSAGEGPDLLLLRAELELRRGGLSRAVGAFERLVRSAPGTPEAFASLLCLGLTRGTPLPAGDPPRGASGHVLSLVVRARAQRAAAAGRLGEALGALTGVIEERQLSDARLIRLMAFLERATPRSTDEVRERVFLGLETAMELSAPSVSVQLDAAEAALLLGPRSPWCAAAPVWLAEVEAGLAGVEDEPARRHCALRLQSLRGLRALLDGADEAAVLACWRGLSASAVSADLRRAFERRFGRSPPLVAPR
ncbi:MAG: protein kinase [Planctomycetota bacterium]